MSLRIVFTSDVHAERGVSPEDFPCPEGDVYLACGDIFEQTKKGETKGEASLGENRESATNPISWLLRWTQHANPDAPVFFVPGNHDFWHGDMTKTMAFWQSTAKGTRVRVLDNASETFKGARFSGTTLWSGLDFHPRGKHGQWPVDEMDELQLSNDFRTVRVNDEPFGPEAMLTLHRRALEFLEEALTQTPVDMPHVVLSHWPATLESLHPWLGKVPGFSNSLYHYNHLPRLARRASLWFSGHTHTPMDYFLTSTRTSSEYWFDRRHPSSGIFSRAPMKSPWPMDTNARAFAVAPCKGRCVSWPARGVDGKLVRGPGVMELDEDGRSRWISVP